MWMMKRKSAEELDSILYFLSSALTSVMDEASYLAHHQAALPQIGAGLATAEIASRLAMFRQQVCDVSEREFVIVTRLARARHWAHQLRRHEPHLRADIDAFLAGTVQCEAMARERAPDAQSLFDGHAQPKRFLADRVPHGRAAAEAAVSLVERLEAAERGERSELDAPRYLIGGKMSVETLTDACETLLTRMSAHYGWEDDPGALPGDAETWLNRDDVLEGATDDVVTVRRQAADPQTQAGEQLEPDAASAQAETSGAVERDSAQAATETEAAETAMACASEAGSVSAEAAEPAAAAASEADEAGGRTVEASGSEQRPENSAVESRCEHGDETGSAQTTPG